MFLQNPSFTQSADAGHPANIEREVPPAKQPVRVLCLGIPNASEFRSTEILSKATRVSAERGGRRGGLLDRRDADGGPKAISTAHRRRRWDYLERELGAAEPLSKENAECLSGEACSGVRVWCVLPIELTPGSAHPHPVRIARKHKGL